MLRKVAVNFSMLGGGQVASGIIGFLFFAFVARHFGPELFGKFILIGSYVRVVSLIVGAGVTPIAIREFALQRDNPTELALLFNDVLSMTLALGVAGYLGLMAVSLVFSQDRALLALMAVAALPLLFDAFTTSYTAYYAAHERMAVPSLYGVALTAFSSAVGAAVLLAGYGLFALFAASVLTSLLATVVFSVIFRAQGLRFSVTARFAAWQKLFKLIVPFVPIYISTQLNRVVGIVLLGRLTGPLPTAQSVGFYSPAQSITNAAVMLAMGLRRVLISPVAVRLGRGQDVSREIDLAMKLVVAVFCLPLVLGTSFMAPGLIALLYGEQYGSSATVLVIVGWAGALQIAAMVCESFLFSHPKHNYRDYAPGAITSVLVNVALCVLLIADYGAIGAAIAAVFARLVYFAFAVHYSRRQMDGKALRLRHFGDLALLLVSAFGLWTLVTGWIANAWLGYCVAGALTLPLLAAFMAYQRSRLVVSNAQ
ncbi:MAG: oligosaccharide flippase family protein [Gammaproteobacteria bacterium]|nr:oligosaccharide flippase family protein [Gammaproteobacteria bacterium]